MPSEAQYDTRTSRRRDTRSSIALVDSNPHHRNIRRGSRLATRSGSCSGRHPNVRKKIRWTQSERFANDESESENKRGRPRRSRTWSSMLRRPRYRTRRLIARRPIANMFAPSNLNIMLRPPKYDGTKSLESRNLSTPFRKLFAIQCLG